MEDITKIEAFVQLESGNGDGSGIGRGDGSGYGSGIGRGDGSGYGSGSGYGGGSGSGYGGGSGYGYGYGYGYGDGIKSINGNRIWMIDDRQTIIDCVRGNVAKGGILRSDLTIMPCYIVKQDGLFAHGATLRDAMDALRDKLFEDMPEDERIQAFVDAHDPGKAYPNQDLFDWHHRLTGSCLAGRTAFVQSHGLSLDGTTTVEEFIRLTEHDYGGEVVRRLKPFYAEWTYREG